MATHNEITPTQEAFLRNRAAGMSICDAYMVAGFKVKTRASAHALGWKLLQKVHIKSRLRELVDEHIESVGAVTRETIAATLDAAIEQAANLDQPGVVIAGAMAKAKLFGLEAPRKVEANHTHNHISRMSQEELNFELAVLLNKARVAAGGQALPLPPPPASRVEAEKAAETVAEDEDVNFLGDE